MLERDGVLQREGGVIRLREERHFLIRAVAAAFDAYLEQTRRVHSRVA